MKNQEETKKIIQELDNLTNQILNKLSELGDLDPVKYNNFFVEISNSLYDLKKQKGIKEILTIGELEELGYLKKI